MDISATIAELKKDPEFAARVGMVLVHNGIVRGTSRKDGRAVTCVDVSPDRARISELCREYEARPGIYRVLAEAASGRLNVGDDLLFIVVAGDFRENVKPVLAELLDRIKAEAVVKQETCAS
ncbi:MAG: molybdenum cofactor biosynthesis protein MoaE [Thermodesulfobacteriota bacterium]